MIKLHWQIFIGIILGATTGYLSRDFGFSTFILETQSIIGVLFINALSMIIVPLILSAVSVGVLNLLSKDNLSHLALKTLGYFSFTTVIASLLGVTLVNFIKPGIDAELDLGPIPDGFFDNIKEISTSYLDIIPLNPMATMVQGDILPVVCFSLIWVFSSQKLIDQ